MPTPLESALEAVARMSPGSEIDPALWRLLLEELRKESKPAQKERSTKAS